jgi:DhnA family fructose-bisphosphate aldolase class Ia
MDKAERLKALLPGGKGVWIPIDHGASDFPNAGLDDLEGLIKKLVRAEVDVILAQKGVVSRYAHLCQGTKTNMVIHYSVSTRHAGANSNNKVLVGGADETLSRGGIGVSSQVNMGSETEPEMIERMGELNRQAHLLGLPSFGMVYARGPNLNPVEGDLTGCQAHAVRLAFELGCDAAKTTWTGTQASFSHVVAAAPIPLVGRWWPCKRRPTSGARDGGLGFGSGGGRRLHGASSVRPPPPRIDGKGLGVARSQRSDRRRSPRCL